MEIVQSSEVQWARFAEQRIGEIRQKRLAVGEAGQADNFEFSIVWVPEHYSTPRHRHTFDQIRFVRRGEFGYGANRVQKAGEITYFSEGTYYAQNGTCESETLLLQFGSATGTGFVKGEELRKAMHELKQIGEFHDGVFTEYRDGRKINRDATEAIYEHYYGAPIRYRTPRYEDPVLIHPEAFEWAPTEHEGILYKNLGVFTERDITIGFWRIEPDAALTVAADTAPVLLYTLTGVADVDGQMVGEEACIHLARGESTTITAREQMDVYMIRLPRFNDQELAEQDPQLEVKFVGR